MTKHIVFTLAFILNFAFYTLLEVSNTHSDAFTTLFFIASNAVFLLSLFIINYNFCVFQLRKTLYITNFILMLYAAFNCIVYIKTGDFISFAYVNLIIQNPLDTLVVSAGSTDLLSASTLIFSLITSLLFSYSVLKVNNLKPNELAFILSICFFVIMLMGKIFFSDQSKPANTVNTEFNGSLIGLSNNPLQQAPDFNVVIFIYESLSWHYSSFNDGYENTPHLKQLADEGVYFSNTHAFTPHSSKSLFSILCGTPPLLNRAILETASNLETTCLPHMFNQHGYDTTFIQSASGNFESRARLVNTMGYQNFYSRENLKSPVLGYLASDDRRMYDQFKTLTTDQTQPFLMTFFTSMSHHPYAFPENYLKQKKINTSNSAIERYTQLQTRADETLGDIIQQLKKTGQYDNTLILALADHGEGFGINGVKQHDWNVFTEGTRVPTVIKLPKSFDVQPKQIDSQYSLVNVAHYVVDIINDSTSFNINALFKKQKPLDSTVTFNCWHEKKCLGWKQDKQRFIAYMDKNIFKEFEDTDEPKNKLINQTTISEEHTNYINSYFSQYFNTQWKPKYKKIEYPTEHGTWKCAKNNSRCKFVKN